MSYAAARMLAKCKMGRRPGADPVIPSGIDPFGAFLTRTLRDGSVECGYASALTGHVAALSAIRPVPPDVATAMAMSPARRDISGILQRLRPVIIGRDSQGSLTEFVVEKCGGTELLQRPRPGDSELPG